MYFLWDSVRVKLINDKDVRAESRVPHYPPWVLGARRVRGLFPAMPSGRSAACPTSMVVSLVVSVASMVVSLVVSVASALLSIFFVSRITATAWSCLKIYLAFMQGCWHPARCVCLHLGGDIRSTLPQPTSMHTLLHPTSMHMLLHPTSMHTLLHPTSVHAYAAPSYLHAHAAPSYLHAHAAPSYLHAHADTLSLSSTSSQQQQSVMLPPFPPTCPLPPTHTHKHTQLVRILVKLFLNSLVFSKLIEGAVWAPHRLSEVQIRTYLRATLGLEAPQPQWGLPTGWGHYLAGRGVARWGMVASMTLASSLNASGSEPGRSIWKQRTRGSFYGTDMRELGGVQR